MLLPDTPAPYKRPIPLHHIYQMHLWVRAIFGSLVVMVMDANQEKIMPEAKDRFPTRFKKGHKSPIEGFIFCGAGKWTPELRKRKKVEKLAESRAKQPSWTEEKRQAAKERIIARNLKAKDDEERMRRRRMTRYLKDTITGKIYAWTEQYAQMERMQDLGWHDPKYTDLSKL